MHPVSGFAELRRELRLLRGGYPRFVTGGARETRPSHIPVFVYHTIDPDEFEEHLAFLRANGYSTIGADEYHEIVTGARRAPPDTVMLTIDDGRASVWNFAHPLLERYQARATVFLIPGYTRHADRCTPTLADVWSGRCSRSDVPCRDPELMSWAEIQAAHNAGTLDFQAHTLYHHRVAVTPDVRDFYNPLDRTAFFDIPVPPEMQADLCGTATSHLFGMPIYGNDSLMSGRPRYIPAHGLASACIRHVAENGGASYFRQRGWRERLSQVMADAQAARNEHGRSQTAAELASEIFDNLRTCREVIEARLPGKRVRHLCYPYGIGSELAIAMSREAGYVSNYWLVRADRAENRPGDDPFNLVRLKGDYLMRLPGKGRKSLSSIIAAKAVRRLRGRPVH